MNIAESERMRAMLAGETDLVVVNSCAVTCEALRQTRKAIRRARRDHPSAGLVVTGCAADIDRTEVGAMDEVDALVANAAKLDPRAWNVAAEAPPVTPARTRAFVAVQNGCDHASTFCVIRQGHGTNRSLTVAGVLRAIEAHLANGVKEFVLTGVDLTSWGDDYPNAPGLGALAETILAAFPDLPRLRLSSVDGVEIDPALFDLLAHEPRLMPHLLPSLQHGADLIAAVPTEDEARHADNLLTIDDLDIVHAHVFPFSPRPGTPAPRMPQVAREVVKGRAAWPASLVGETFPVLAERDGTGYAPNYARIALPSGTAAVEIIDVTPSGLREGLLA